MPRMNFIEQTINQKQFYWTNNIDIILNIKQKMQHSPIVVLGYVSSGADNFNSEQNDCVKDRKDICLKPVPGNEIVASVKMLWG